LPDIPSDLLYTDAPTKPYIWEATRLFVVPSVPSNRRIAIQTLLMQKMSSTARELGASHVIGIVPAVFSRWMTRLGLLSALPVGRVLDFDNEKCQAALMNVSLQSA
jgi:N-acyl-L-homoserine lactone synthetase